MIRNDTGVSLPLAVWAVHDTYDYIDEPNYISATSLMRPIRQLALAGRVPVEQRQEDVVDYVARAMGHSLHAAIESAWTHGYERALTKLGYPSALIERIRVNPTDEELAANKDCIPIYLEQRTIKKIDGFSVGGKYDMVAAGILQDYKSTSVYGWIKGNKDRDYMLQGSIYRWLDPVKITEDYIRINFIFTDWQKGMTSDPSYPQQRVQVKDVPLMSIADTERWIKDRLADVKKYMEAPEDQIPECTPEELWLSDPVHKYYADPTKTVRATKNFDSLSEALDHKNSKGKGVVITVPGTAKRCEYCSCSPICSQYQRMQEK